MDIYAPKGTKVQFIGCDKGQQQWGGNDAATKLVAGETYEVESTEVHSSYTNVYLKEFPGKRFNSVCFKQVE